MKTLFFCLLYSNIKPDIELHKSARGVAGAWCWGEGGHVPVLGLTCPHVTLGPARHVVSEVDLGDEGSTPGAGCGDLQHRLVQVTCDHRAGAHHDVVV